MIVVKYGDKDGKYSLECNGHATGNQDVCTAVSTIVQTLVGYLLNTHDKVSYDLCSGWSMIQMETDNPVILGAWELAIFGLEQMGHNFPDYIRTEKFKII